MSGLEPDNQAAHLSHQVHVSEPGHGEDISGVAPFGDETSNPPREVAADSRHFLTEETLKKHTKMQERLYLQRISEEQPLLVKPRRKVRVSYFFVWLFVLNPKHGDTSLKNLNGSFIKNIFTLLMINDE